MPQPQPLASPTVFILSYSSACMYVNEVLVVYRAARILYFPFCASRVFLDFAGVLRVALAAQARSVTRSSCVPFPSVQRGRFSKVSRQGLSLSLLTLSIKQEAQAARGQRAAAHTRI